MPRPGTLETLLLKHAGVAVTLGPRRSAPAMDEAAFRTALEAMRWQRRMEFIGVVAGLAAAFVLVLAYSVANGFSVAIAKIAIGSGGVLSVACVLALRGIWHDYAQVDLVLATLPALSSAQRQAFVLAAGIGLRQARSGKSEPAVRAVTTA